MARHGAFGLGCAPGVVPLHGGCDAGGLVVVSRDLLARYCPGARAGAGAQLGLGPDRIGDPIGAFVYASESGDDRVRGPSGCARGRRSISGPGRAAGRLPAHAPDRDRPGPGGAAGSLSAKAMVNGPERCGCFRSRDLTLVGLAGRGGRRTEDAGRPAARRQLGTSRADRFAGLVLPAADSRSDYRASRRGRHGHPADSRRGATGELVGFGFLRRGDRGLARRGAAPAPAAGWLDSHNDSGIALDLALHGSGAVPHPTGSLSFDRSRRGDVWSGEMGEAILRSGHPGSTGFVLRRGTDPGRLASLFRLLPHHGPSTCSGCRESRLRRRLHVACLAR
jgi:hypothetical protein